MFVKLSDNLSLTFQNLSKTKHNPISQNLQEWNANNFMPDEKFMFNPEQSIKSMTQTKRRVFECLLKLSTEHIEIYPSVAHIANYAGCTPQSVHRLLNQLEEENLISRRKRYNKTNFYRVSEYFFNPHIRSKLSHMFKFLMVLPLVFLLSNNLHAKNQHRIQREFVRSITKQGFIKKRRYIKYPNGGVIEQHMYFKKVEVRNMSGSVFGHENQISMVLRNRSDINLSKWGQIKLTPFPDEALLYAFESMKYVKNIKDPFNFVYKLAYEYCRQNEIKPDYQRFYALRDYYKMPENAILVLPTEKVSDNGYYGKKENNSKIKKPLYKSTFSSKVTVSQEKPSIKPSKPWVNPHKRDLDENEEYHKIETHRKSNPFAASFANPYKKTHDISACKYCKEYKVTSMGMK